MFKVSKGLCPEIVKGLFQFRNEILYNLGQVPNSHSPCKNSFSGTESIKFLGPKIWKLIPDEMKELESLWEFKRAIKLWKHPALADYANNTFIGLVFFNKGFCFINNIFLQH